jgi:hypothetical protein
MVEPTKFAPRKQLLECFKEGWRLIPGHPYQASDWAILVYMPTYPKPVPVELMKRWALRFRKPEKRQPISNVTAAARHAVGKLNDARRARAAERMREYA